jgi:hypothetical protein
MRSDSKFIKSLLVSAGGYILVSLWFFYIIFDTFLYLDTSEVSWFGIDNTTSYIAQLFFLEDGWRFPLLRNPLYGDTLSTSITFTGPSPILVLLMKVFGVQPELQFFGFWILLNIFLQLVFGYRFLRLLGGSVIFSRYFSVLFVTPFLIIKVQSHFWLTSHYLILWSLCILFSFLMHKKFRVWEVCLLLSLSYLSNIYILAMVIVVILLTFAIRMASTSRNSRILFTDATVSLLTLASVFFIFDGFDRQENLYQSVKMYLSPTYGVHGFNLLTFVNPDTGIVAEGAANIPANLPLFSVLPISLGMIPGAYEGFMYLGLGLIIVAVAMLFLKNNSKLGFFRDLNRNQKRLFFLFFFSTFLFSVSYRVGIGSWSVVFPFPEYLDWLFGTFRSSGRFMWPVAYALIGVLIIKFYKTLKLMLGRRMVFVALLAVLTFQHVDILVPLIKQKTAVRITNSETDFKTNEFMMSLSALRSFKSIRAYPQGDVLMNHYAELNYLAWSLKIKTDLHFTSRNNISAMYARESETFDDLCTGNLRPRVAYAVTNERVEDLENCRSQIKPIFQDQFHTYYGVLS